MGEGSTIYLLCSNTSMGAQKLLSHKPPINSILKIFSFNLMQLFYIQLKTYSSCPQRKTTHACPVSHPGWLAFFSFSSRWSSSQSSNLWRNDKFYKPSHIQETMVQENGNKSCHVEYGAGKRITVLFLGKCSRFLSWKRSEFWGSQIGCLTTSLFSGLVTTQK